MDNQEVIEILLNEQKCLDRNDGVQCDRKCESCDLVMDAETIREAYSMAISALQAQDVPDTNVGDIYECPCGYGWDKSKVFRHHFCPNCGRAVEPSYNLTKTESNSDMVSRQNAIEAVEKESQVDGAYGYMDTKSIVDLLNDLPSAQPEPSTEIQEILNYLDTTLHPIVSPDNWDVYAELHDMVSRLPSAQPEPSIPISWIEKQIDWLKSMDNEFSNITAMNISVLVKKWRKENDK